MKATMGLWGPGSRLMKAFRRTRRHAGDQATTFVHEGQTYVLEGYRALGDHIMTIRPLPALKGTRTDLWPEGFWGSNRETQRGVKAIVSDCQAHVEFKVLTESYGKFCGIVVPEQYQRQGVGRAMVLALFSQFPKVTFHNTALNAKSGPFFQALQGEFPENLAPIAGDQISNWPLSTPTEE